MRLFLILLVLTSFKSYASYRCDIEVSESNKNALYATTTIEASDSELKSESLENYLGKKGLTLKFMMDGWSGEEQATFVFTKGEELVSEKKSFMGEQKETIWFDSMKFDVNCSLSKGPKTLVSKN